jgi:hypothetical protein
VARGLIYLLMGILAIRLALPGESGSAGPEGAMRTVATQPMGEALLWVLVLGLGAHAVSQLAQAVAFPPPDSSKLDRVGYAGSAVLSLGLAALAMPLLSADAGGAGSPEDRITAQIMSAPIGRVLVGAAGAALIGFGVWHAWHHLTEDPDEHLDLSGASPWAKRAVSITGRFGPPARGVSVALIGWFLLRAALWEDPDQASGLDAALQRLQGETWGLVLLVIVGIGFVIYALHCGFEARFRRIG